MVIGDDGIIQRAIQEVAFGLKPVLKRAPHAALLEVVCRRLAVVVVEPGLVAIRVFLKDELLVQLLVSVLPSFRAAVDGDVVLTLVVVPRSLDGEGLAIHLDQSEGTPTVVPVMLLHDP